MGEDRKKGELIKLFKESSVDNTIPKQEISIIGDSNQVAGGDIYNHINEKKVVRNKVNRGSEFISSAHAKKLQDLVKKAADRDVAKGVEQGKAFAKWYSKLKNYFKVPSYLEIPAHQGEQAISWMSQQVAITRPALRRNDNAAWRKELYAAINARGRELGMSKSEIHFFASELTGKSVISLSKLGERDLKSVHTSIMKRKTKPPR